MVGLKCAAIIFVSCLVVSSGKWRSGVKEIKGWRDALALTGPGYKSLTLSFSYCVCLNG